jgi:hypothetical protein
MKKIFPGLILIFLVSVQLSAQNVGVNTNTPEAVLDVNGDVIFRTGDLAVADGITLALDVSSTRFSYYRITGPVADFTLAGITAGVDGRLLTLFNRSGFAMQLNNEDASALPADQIMTGTDANMIIPFKGIINLQYDATEQKWIVKSSSKGTPTIAPGGLWDLNGNDIFNTNNGNVGIGINPPLAPLHIKKDLEALRIEGTSPYISFYNDGSPVPKAFLQNTGNNLYLGTSGGNTIGITQVYSNGNAIMTMLPTGKTGIGTPTPGDRLTVQTLTNDYGLTHTDGNVMVSTWIGNFSGASGGWLGTKSNHSLNFFTFGGVARMTIVPNGNIGIGTLAPPEKLTVQTLNNSYGISHRSSEANNVLATRIGGSSAGIGTFSPTHMRIFCNGISQIFIAESTGNVGIGTENFGTYKLEVNGSIRTKEVVVELAGWPDYVFHKDYKLPLLSDVEKFIQQNHRLPNMASAAEVEKNGLLLGDTQKKMMEKIEELTLYVISLKKEIDLLKSK